MSKKEMNEDLQLGLAIGLSLGLPIFAVCAGVAAIIWVGGC